jgi:pimeloyl-ACP methyl ester carboxylesterase
MRFAFLHGGPGFNSYAEQATLEPVFAARGHQVAFWNEPSRLRPAGELFEPSGACERWLTSAERFIVRAAGSGPVHVIAHSFTAHAAMNIARRHEYHVAGLVLVAPAADPLATFRNVMEVAREDLAETKPDVANAIAACSARTRTCFDEAMREGLMNVLHDARLFTHYWADPVQMQASLAARARPEGQFDVESFFAVLDDFALRGSALLSAGPVTVPTLVVFGAEDRITPVDEQQPAIDAAIPHARIETLGGCSHYVHLDRPDAFVDIVANWAADASNTRSSRI